ncbi:MAG: class II aldolase/adducin family protein [Candidatus Omnitrophica bacterium]|nr:class II aldolase/adducin family protein [Candidatus Omnitrophota bacterium]
MNKLKVIAKYGKLLCADQLAIGSGGNLSIRDERSVIIKKKGASMSSGSAKNYIKVPLNKINGPLKNDLSSETPFHIACYESRPDIGAVIHVHSPFIVAAGSKIKRLNSNSYEFDYILKSSVPVIKYIQPGSIALARAVAKEIKNGSSAVILKRHGAISVGKTLEEAYIRIRALERACMTFVFSR